MIPLAENILNGKFSVDGTAPNITQEPIYPAFLAGILAVFGKSLFWLGVAILQGILAVLSSLIIYIVGKDLFNEKIGLLACIMTAFYPFSLIQSLSIADTTIFIFLLTLLILNLVKNAKYNTTWSTIACGIIIGLILLTRDFIMVFIPFIVIYLFINLGKKIAFKDTIIILGISITLIMPWLIRNYRLSGSILISAHSAEVLLMGNSPEGWNLINNDITIDEIRLPEDTASLWSKYPLSKIKDPREIIRISKFYNHEALVNIRENFCTFLKMLWVKFYKFWSWKLYPSPTGTLFIKKDLRSLGNTLSYVPILVLGIAGIALSYSHWKRLAILYFMFISFTAVYVLTIPLTRYRIPLDLFLTIFCSYSLIRIYDALRRKL